MLTIERGYMGNKPTKADLQESIPYGVKVKMPDGTIKTGIVAGSALPYPTVHLSNGGDFLVSWECLIHSWETGEAIVY